MHVVCATEPDIAEQRHILAQCASGIVHSTPEYTRMLAQCVGGEPHWLMAYAGADPVGMFPFLAQRIAPYGLVINSLPFFGTHGGCLVRDDAPQEDVRRALLRAFAAYAHAQPDLISASVSISFAEYPYAPLYAETLHPDAVDVRRAQILPLPDTNAPERIMAGHRAARMIRKALRQGFVLTREESDEAWQALYTLQHAAALRQNAPPKSKEQIFGFRNCLRSEQRALWCAYQDDTRVALLLLTLHKPWVHYAIPVFDQAYGSQQPMTALMYTAMCHYAEQGYAQWSFGGTPIHNESLHRFKASWGARDAAYGYMTTATSYGKNIFAENANEIMKCFSGYYIYPIPAKEKST